MAKQARQARQHIHHIARSKQEIKKKLSSACQNLERSDSPAQAPFFAPNFLSYQRCGWMNIRHGGEKARVIFSTHADSGAQESAKCECDNAVEGGEC
jgi:hypothetical protein